MERLTNTAWRNFDPWKCCGQDNFCTRGCHEKGGCNNGCIVPKLYGRLAAYEDTGLELEEIKELRELCTDEVAELARTLHRAIESGEADHLRDLLKAENEGRLVVLPCKVGDTVYVIGEKRIMRCGIDEAYLDDKKGLEYLVSFFCDSDCDGCPFNNWSQSYSGEWYCDGEYGQSVVVGSEIGKTVFLTREEAEAALKGGDG